MGMWPQEREEMLKKLWAEGLSASKIALRIGSITRNAVLGKRQRLDLPTRKGLYANVKRQPKPHRADGALAQRVKKLRNGTHPTPSRCDDGDRLPPPSDWLTFAELEPNSCRWPAGEGKDIRFCGAPKCDRSESYCDYHEARSRTVYQPRRRVA